MKLSRAFVLLLLSLAVPTYGFASLGASHKPCPMQMHGMAHPAPADAADGMDCCVDLETFAKTGNPCKAGQDCHAGQMAPLPTAARAPLPASESAALPWAALAPIGLTGDAFWRPPRSV